MLMRSCPPLQILEEFGLGKLDVQEFLFVEEHLLSCEDCIFRLKHLTLTDPIIETLRDQWSNPAFTITSEVHPIQRHLHALFEQITIPVTLQNTASIAFLASEKSKSVSKQIKASAERMGIQLPEKVAHYQLKEKLGIGGMGEVYRAWDEKLERSVAIKFILDRRSWNSKHQERFIAEAGMLARLAHPQIVQIYEVGEEGGRDYLVLEYLSGGELAAFLRGEPQPAEDSALLVAQLARAVHHAHTQGILHRDLKPSNILIEKPVLKGTGQPSCRLNELNCKIADFGLAKRMEVPSETETGTVMGTPGYMAPECLKLHRDGVEQGPTIDVYSLGAILYELLTGRPPFRGETVAETLVEIQTAQPLPPRKLRPKLPRDLETICLHCLEKTPQRRYATALQLADDLDRYLNHQPIQVRPAHLLERAGKWILRKPALAALVFVMLSSLALLVAGALMYERRLHSELMKTGAERDRADSGYQNAREALERMLNKLDDPRRANIPQLQALRREQQHELVQFLEKVTATATSSKDSKILQDVATALYTSGRLRLALGEIDQSRQDLQRSINLLNELQQQLPEDVSLQMQKAASLQALAATYPLGESNLQLNEDAMNIQSRVVKQEPDNHSYQQKLAITFHNLGSNHIRLQNFEKAEAFLIKSLEVLNQISIHESRSYQVEIAETEINLSLVYEMLKKSSLAEEYIIRALQRLESILQSDSQNIRVLLSLSALRINRANMLASRTRHAEALKLLDINLRDLRELLQKEPELKDIKDRLFETQGSRGNILSLLQRHSEAAAAFEDVIRFAEPQQADFYQLFLASNRSKVGEYRLSLVACQQAARYDGMNYEQKTFLAMIYCNNVSWITRDTSLAVSEKTSLCQQCHDQALRWLNEARIQAGETAWKKFKHALFWEPLWKPMREYPPIWNWVKQS